MTKKEKTRAKERSLEAFPVPEHSIEANYVLIGKRDAFEMGYLKAMSDIKEEPISEDLEEEIADWLGEGLPNEDELAEYIEETARNFSGWQHLKDFVVLDNLYTKAAEEMIDKACVWLEKNTGFFNEKDFRKAMEEWLLIED